jgi:ATP-dependent 26S proteasome regulatory subunit
MKYDDGIFNSDKNNYLLVLKEVHALLPQSRVCSLLQAIAARTMKAADGNDSSNKYRVQVVIVDSQLKIPPELEKLTTIIEMRPPTVEQIEKIIDSFIANRKNAKHQNISIEPSFKVELKEALTGLSEFEIKQLLSLAVEDNKLDKNDLPLIHEEKRQLIQKSGLLELVDVESLVGVGGLKKLREFIRDNTEIFQNPGLARAHGVDAPSGIMIVGMPGCGKSLMAKTVAKEFGVPLLKLDVGRLMGKYVGECENNLHRAIAVAESAAPCVLWIDEIEKAFSGIGEGGGGGSSMTRMFGIFLTWMQEKTASIYVVATANNIDNLPPEFLRRGRFDEIFQVNFPTRDEREEILKHHIKKRNGNHIPKDVDVYDIANKFEDKEHYSGADIESIVKGAMKRVFAENMKNFGPQKLDEWRTLSTEDLATQIEETKSSYHSQKDKLDKMLEKLKDLDAKSASEQKSTS